MIVALTEHDQRRGVEPDIHLFHGGGGRCGRSIEARVGDNGEELMQGES